MRKIWMILLCLFAPSFVWAAAPELVIQKQVASKAVVFSPDGKILAAVGGSKPTTKLQLWDVPTGKLLKEIATKGNLLTGVAFAQGGDSVVSCSGDGGAELWDVETGTRRIVLSDTTCRAITVSPNGRIVAVNGQSYASSGKLTTFVQLIQLPEGKVVKKLDLWMPESLTFSPDGKTLASGGYETLRVWDVASGHKRYDLKGYNNSVNGISISADGKLIASADRKTVHVWNLLTGTKIHSIEAETGGLAFSPVGSVLYLGINQGAKGADRRLIDGLSGATIKTFKGPWLLPDCGTFSPNGELLAISGVMRGVEPMSGGIELWNVRTGQLLRQMRNKVITPSSVAFAPQGSVLAISGWNGVKLFDLSTLQPLPIQTPQATSCKFADKLEFTPSGNALIAVLNCGRLYALSQRAQPVTELKTLTSALVGDFALSPDGSILVASTKCMGNGTSCQTGAVAWDLSSGKIKWTVPLPGNFTGVSKIAFRPDGKHVAIANQQVYLLDAENGASISNRRMIYRVEGITIEQEPQSIVFSKNGHLAVGLVDGQIIEYAGREDEKGIYLTTRKPGDDHNSSASVNVLRYSPDESILIAGCGDGNLLFLRGENSKKIKAHAGEITSIAFSPNGRLIATAGQDAAVRIWQASDFSLLATLVQVEDSDYIIASSKGSYTATPGAFIGVAFKTGSQIFPFEQFDLQLNRPDEVLSHLGTGSTSMIAAYYQAWRGRLKRMNIEEKNLKSDFHTPTLSLLTKGMGVSTRNRVIEIQVRAEDKLIPLDHLKITVNDVPLNGSGGIRLKKRKGSVDVPIKIELSSGINRIRISAVNAQLAESLSETFEIICEAPHPPPITYILAIGVSEYKNIDYNLHYAAKDATDFVNLFHGGADASQVKILTILDHDATRERIMAGKDFLSKAGVDDTAIIFVAGHGLLTDKFDYYFATTDMEFERPDLRGLSFQALEDLLDGIPSRRKLLLVDTCHSGELEDQVMGFDGSNKVLDGNVMLRGVRGVRILSSGLPAGGSRHFLNEIFADLRRGSGAAIISSSSGTEFALESDKWRNGVFTYSVLNGLRSGDADINSDGRTTVSELRDYVINKVQRLTSGAQRPTSRRESLEFDFEITSEDISLRQFRGINWDHPSLCAGHPNINWCKCMIREAKKYFADPLSWIDSMHRYQYAREHGGEEPQGVLEMSLGVTRECGQNP